MTSFETPNNFEPLAFEQDQSRNIDNDPFTLTLDDVSKEANRNKYKIIPKELREQLWKLHFENQYTDLLELLEHIIPLCEDDFELFFLAGKSSANLELYQKAMMYFQKALYFRPDDYFVNFEIAKLFHQAELHELAEKTFEVCSHLEPANFEPVYGRAEALCMLKDYRGARPLLKRVVEIEPKFTRAYELLAVCYIQLAEFENAHNTLNYMISNSHTLGKAVGSSKNLKQLCHMHRLTTCMELGLFDEGRTSIQEAKKFVEKFSQNIALTSEARFQLALANLRLGQTKDAWGHYFHRFEQQDFPSPKRKFTRPRAENISELTGKTVLIWREQGVGDEIELCGLLQEFMLKSGATVILEIDERLVSGVTRSHKNIVVRAPEYDKETLYSAYHDFDYHMPMADILTFLKPNKSIKNCIAPWYKVDTEKAKNWDQKITSDSLRIGFAFGSHFKNAKRDKHKHLNFSLFEKLIKNSDHTWVNLDYTWTDLEFNAIDEDIKSKIFFPDIDLKNDFEQLAAVLTNCDLVVSPYMAVRSLAGALGIPTASFVRGAPYHFDFGASIENPDTFTSPLVPLSTVKQFGDQLETEEFEASLLKHFEVQIEKAEKLRGQ